MSLSPEQRQSGFCFGFSPNALPACSKPWRRRALPVLRSRRNCVGGCALLYAFLRIRNTDTETLLMACSRTIERGGAVNSVGLTPIPDSNRRFLLTNTYNIHII
jgi:hypothetical protein